MRVSEAVYLILLLLVLTAIILWGFCDDRLDSRAPRRGEGFV